METFEVAILELGVTELYLNQRKLEAVKAQAQQEDFSGFAPLPVFDFGDGKPVLTDGHHRAFAAWQMGRPTLTVYWDKDTNTVSKVGQRLYRMALDWCRKAGIESVSQLQGRIMRRRTIPSTAARKISAPFSMRIPRASCSSIMTASCVRSAATPTEREAFTWN